MNSRSATVTAGLGDKSTTTRDTAGGRASGAQGHGEGKFVSPPKAICCDDPRTSNQKAAQRRGEMRTIPRSGTRSSSSGRALRWVGVFGGGSPSIPDTSHGSGPQAPLQLPGAGSGHTTPWFHTPKQICCSGTFDLFLGPDMFQTLPLSFNLFYFIFKDEARGLCGP